MLHALLSFHQETALTLPESDPQAGAKTESAGAGIVVFPSNKELSIRAHGMAPATLRRHLACLVDAGLIIRRDSPNGKRFARRGQGGEIEDAFGFDLTPLVARAGEIENLAEEVRAENRAMALLREKITLARRDIVKMIATGMEEGVPGDWEGFHLRYAALSGRYARNLSRADLEALASELAALAAEIQKLLENHVKPQNMSGNESQTERHIQNQTTNSSDLEPSLREGRGEPSGPTTEAGARIEPEPEIWQTEPELDQTPSAPRTYPLGMVLEACPDIVDYAKGGRFPPGAISRRPRRRCVRRSASRRTPGRRRWRSWANTTPSIVIAAILQRGEEIKSAGGYLRVLTAKAQGRGVLARARADGAVARQGGKGGARTQEGGVMLPLTIRRIGELRSHSFGAEHAELSGAVEQALDRGRAPAGSAARRALIHGLELRADLRQGQIGIGASDAGDEGQEPFAAGLRVAGRSRLGSARPSATKRLTARLSRSTLQWGRAAPFGWLSRLALSTRTTSSQR